VEGAKAKNEVRSGCSSTPHTAVGLKARKPRAPTRHKERALLSAAATSMSPGTWTNKLTEFVTWATRRAGAAPQDIELAQISQRIVELCRNRGRLLASAVQG
jgi:hypothetical protein